MTTTHPNDMTREELRELVTDMSMACPGLAQHLNFANDFLKEERKDGAYKEAEQMAYAIGNMPYTETPAPAFSGDDGLVCF